MGTLKQSFIWRLILPVPLILAGTLVAIWYFIPNMIADNVRSGAVSTAEETANQFKTLRGYYTNNVVKKAVKSKTLKPSFNHKSDPGAIPLPATLIHDLSALLEQRDTSVRLYSPYPFPNRADRNLDPFQTEAWDSIIANPEKSFVREEKDGQGRTVIRVGIADRMVAQGCVDCHNKRADTPKNDWKLNDVRGVLEIASVIEPQLAAGAAVSQRIVVGGTIVTIALVTILIVLMLRGVALPLRNLGGSMSKLADGEKSAEVPMTHRTDEIGDMARTVEVFKNSLIENDRLQEEQRQAEARTREEEKRREQATRDIERKEAEKRDRESAERAQRAERIEGLISEFDSQAAMTLDRVASAATEMRATAETMMKSAEQTSHQSAAVAEASEEATNNVQTVASAAEELSASIAEISRQVIHSNEIAQNAVAEAKETNEKVEGLAEAAQKIGDVVDLINDIAAQTNLLALNATIEAARAGEAGKGFAVVASEVKSLATQTSKATEEIGAQISAIQAATTDAVQAIQSIGSTIGEIGEIATSVAAAVDQQGTATREIAGSVQQAAAGTQEVSGNITQVTQAASESKNVSTQLVDSAGSLAQQGDRLRDDVKKFLDAVRAA